MEPSPQAENDSVPLTHKVTSIRDATTTQAASSEHPLATSTSAQGDGPVEQHSDLTLSSRGRARKKNPKFMDYETDQDLQEEKTKGKRRSPVRKNVIKGKVAQKKSGRGRKKRAVKPTEDCDDRETAETQPAEPAEEEQPSNASPKKTPKAKKRTPAKTRTPAKKTLPEQPKARKKQATKKQVVQDVGPAETLQADQAQSTSVPEEEEEQEECVSVGGRPRRSAAKAALKYLHALAREVLGGPSNDVEAQQRSHSGASSPISEPDTGRNAPKRRGWPKGRKRKRRDTEGSDGDEDFLPGGLSGEDAEEEEGSEGELESDLEPAVESKAQHRINRNIINQARVHGTAPNGLPNNMLLPCWESTQSNQKFRENHQSSWVFPNWIPSMNDWSIVPQSVLEEYLPQEMQSAAFKISREGLNKAETPPLQKLNRFEAVDTHPERWDTLMFTGGPVWAMEWCPSPDGSSENQYVALACHRGMDDQHCSSKKYHGPGLIQLWDLGKLEYGSSATSRPSLVYGLAQDKGFIWQLKWCPAGAWELPTYPRKAPYLPRLGLLAAATSTGVVTIYSLPHPQALLAGKEPANSEESSQVPPVFKVKGVITLKLGSFRAPHNEMSGQVLSMDWSAMKDHSIVALGFYDGLVGLWNLSSKSSFMRMREPDRSLTFLPYRCFQAHDNCVRALAFCPASSDLLVTAGDDRVLKTWDLTRLYDCINAQKRHLTTEIFWPLHGSGCFLSQESTYAPNGSQGMHFLDLGFNKIKAAFLVPRMATMWSMSFSDWMNCLLTSDTVGEVIFDLLPRLNSNIQNTKLTQQRRFPVYFTDMVPFEASSASDETAAGGGEGEEGGDEEGPAAVPSENDVDRPPGGAESLTQTYREAVKQYYLHYRDFDMRTFKSFQTRQPWKRMRNTEYSTRVDFDVMPLGALHKVRFNPNMSGHTWLVSGGQAGLVRLHCLRSMCREDTKKLVAKCKKQFNALYSPTPPQQGQSPLQDTTETVTAALDQHH